MLGYLSNILRYPSKYCNYTSKKQFGRFPHSLRPHPVDNFFTLHLTIFFIEHKRCRIRFRMGCILILFSFLWIINVKFTNFVFLNFLFSNIVILAYLDHKLPFLSLKFLQNYIYIQNTGWNNSNLHRFGLKSQKFHFLPFIGAQKSSHTQTFKYMSRIQFSS